MSHERSIGGKGIYAQKITYRTAGERGDIMRTNEYKKIRLLVCFIHAHVGGAMTSLINFLNALDDDKYDVDVMFYENDPNDRYGIKDTVNILPQGKIHESRSIKNLLRKAASPKYVAARIQDFYYKRRGNKLKAVQIMSKQGYIYSRSLDREYDAAIAYEYGWCMNYVLNRVKAKRKILWNHLDMEKTGMDYRVDKRAIDAMDALVFVSADCMEKHIRLHPEHSGKCCFIPNLLTSDYVKNKGRGDAELPFDNADKYIKFVTVARVRFEQKAQDRAVRVFSRLKRDGLLDRVKWLIIGSGRDMEKLENMIKDDELGEYIYPIGQKLNPMPYVKQCDICFMPSHYEGKPMAVTEGFIMGLVPVVTAYTSAREQIRDGVDGLVFENNEDALYEGLKSFLKNPEILDKLRANVLKTDYGNEKEIAVFDKLIEKLL